MTLTMRKWWALLGIAIQDGIAYRANMVIWILTDLIPAMIMPLVWLGAYAARLGTQEVGGQPVIAGYTPENMVTYYVVMVFLANVVISHLMWDIAWQIKDGAFSAHLVRPLSVFQYYFFQNVSWRIVRGLVFMPFFILLVVFYHNFISVDNLYLGWELWISIILGHVLSFCLVWAIALAALFVQEARSVFELYYFPMLFLSGQLFPLAVLPSWAVTAGNFLPFKFTTALPTELAVRQMTPEAAHSGILLQLVWIVIAVIAGKILWKSGIKRYTGVGM